MIKSPIFILDSREKWLPCEVETIDKIPDVKGTFRANPVHLDFPDGMKQPQSARPAFYVREQGGGGMIWRQWWSWWLYNPGPPDLRGEGQHEGDWGNSTGKGKSPRSPGKQGDRISRPHVYHHNCRPA
jgi:hypothetical protein